MTYVYNYKDALRKCETLLKQSFAKLLDYSKRDKPSPSPAGRRDDVYVTMKKSLDTVLENVASLKSAYDDLTQHNQCLDLSDDTFAKKFFEYLKCQEPLRLKLIQIIDECKGINTQLDNILNECSVKALDESGNNENSTKCFENDPNDSNTIAEVDLSPVPEICTAMQKLNIDHGLKPYKCTECIYSTAYKGNLKKHMLSQHVPYHSKRCKCNFCDAGGKVTAKKSNSTISLKTKKRKHLNSLKRNETSSFGLLILKRIKGDKWLAGVGAMKRRTHQRTKRCSTKIKIYFCAYCKYHCKARDTLACHIKKKHVPDLNLEEFSFSCTVCGKIFPRDRDRRRHEKKIHVKN